MNKDRKIGTIKFNNTLVYKLIYIFRINDEAHKDVLKIGEASISTNESKEKLTPNCELLKNSAKARINQYTTTAGITYELLWTEIAVSNDNVAFRDHKVHQVLRNSNVKRRQFDTPNNANEWFETDLSTAKNAITAVKEGKNSLFSSEVTHDNSPIIFRPEQKEAIEKTLKRYNVSNNMLWNAKMRFGKTLTALQIAKEKDFKRTIIITHRPVVEKSWFEDFDKIFYDSSNFKVGSKSTSEIKDLEKEGCNYIYFASIQDLRGSKRVGGSFDKNNTIFDTEWDFVIIDEAHEGTKTIHGDNVLKEIVKENTKVLQLSGTPFNLLADFDEKDIYTWDYVMEQSAKNNWSKNHCLDSNPYEELPELNIFTYYLDKLLPIYTEVEDSAFNFREFFSVWTGDSEIDREKMPVGKSIGEFRHEDDVNKFLNLITKEDKESNYPYSTDEYRDFFRHSLWIVPGVKEARALSALMQKHSVFSQFNIVNVAGDGDEDAENEESLQLVEKAITKNPENTYSITLSCGRLTTGVSVPAWTAVMMMSGSYSTSASSYLQTIFRVQTPAKINGKVKEKCYVFDFAPDRTLKMVAEAVSLNTKAGKTDITGKQQMGDFLNFCPVIAIQDSKMITYDVNKMLQQLKRAYAERVVKNGFDDTKIYNDELLKLDGLELEKFQKLEKIIGTTKQSRKTNEVDINGQGFNQEDHEKLEAIEKKPLKERTPEEIELLAKRAEKRKQKDTAISILRAISIRIPLMIYGAEIDYKKDITPSNFTDIVDDKSWEEFMPKGVTKEIYKEFTKYYDEDIFISAGRSIRNKSLGADQLPVTERIKRISEIFSMFRNPDKETVLTPWRVVNMHLGDTIGGYNFFEEWDNTVPIERPRYIEETIPHLFDNDKKILEINSKTGLYALYVAYSFYQNRRINKEQSKNKDEIRDYWQEALKENVFVICKTKMARTIAKRTLAGYKNYVLNIIYYEDINDMLKSKDQEFIDKVLNGKTWRRSEVEMKFDCVVGNPPYQENDMGVRDEGAGANPSASPLYHKFTVNAQKITSQYVSLIMPSRWIAGGKGLDSFRKQMLEDTKMKKLFDYPLEGQIFENVSIRGGICYFLWDNKHNDKCKITINSNKYIDISERFLNEGGSGVFIRNNELISINKKVWDFESKSTKGIIEDSSRIANIVSLGKPYGLRTDTIAHPEKYGISKLYNSKNEALKSNISEENIVELIGLVKKTRVIKYIDRREVKTGLDTIDSFKIFVPKAYGSGTLGETIPSPILATPKQLCTETFLRYGCFNRELEAENAKKYLKTKFFRALVSINKITQDAPNRVYKNIPIQDFTEKSDISWASSISEINQQLCKKYKLDEREIRFIEDRIIEMK